MCVTTSKIIHFTRKAYLTGKGANVCQLAMGCLPVGVIAPFQQQYIDEYTTFAARPGNGDIRTALPVRSAVHVCIVQGRVVSMGMPLPYYYGPLTTLTNKDAPHRAGAVAV